MAVTWTISQTERTLKGSKGDDQISTLHWECTDKETVDGVLHSGRRYGSISIPEPSGDFIPYNDVTHENCINWCKAIMGEDQVKATEDNVASMIATSKAPVTASGVPW
tara:strand:- start:12145 stop:12468 length:324 start_codon:yes stop_codon:yes gene_type:complete